MNKKRIGIVAAGVVVCIGAGLFAAFGIHRHEWTAATCVNPETCVECGETRGEALGHTWLEATCTEAATCSVCGETKGEALGHAWLEATCTEAATCSVCGETEGEALGHTWSEANYQAAATCGVCGETEGQSLIPWFEQKNLSCGFEENASYDYLTSTVDNPELKTTGRVVMSNCRTFDSDETHEAPEGYEWITAKFELLFHDRNTWQHGCAASWFTTDYYDPELCEESQRELEENTAEENTEETSDGETSQKEALEEGEEDWKGIATQYTVNYNGQDYDQCIVYCSNPEQKEMEYAAYIITFEAYFLVPKGYDGAVIAFFDGSMELESQLEDSEEESGEKDSEEESEEEPGEKDSEVPKEESTEATQEEIGALEILTRGATTIRLRTDKEEPQTPQMTVLNTCIPIQPGTALESTSVIWADAANERGFYDLQKAGELEDYDVEQIWNQTPGYDEEELSKETELVEKLDIPEEEGIYRVKAAVRNKEGKARTTEILLIVDGTKPDVHVPKERLTLRSGDVFAPMEGVYGEDNFWADEDCFITVNIEEFQKFADVVQRGIAGTYRLTYYATDPVGNIGSKTISVTLSAGSGNQSGGNQGGGNNGQQAPNQGGDNQQSSDSGNEGGGDGGMQSPGGGWQETAPEAQFMEGMAKEALGIVNQYRADAGLEALAWNDSLYESAKIRAKELVVSFSHTRPDGSSCFTVMSGFSACAENIAYNYGSAASVCNGWYNSEGHRNNMLNAALTQAAIACWYQDGSYYWVNLFGG